jgi:multidrug efflux pump subunit AcrB
LAVDMPPAPQMRRKSTEAIFDGCMERFRPIMMTKHCLA